MGDNFDKDLYTMAVIRYKKENPNVDKDFSAEWNLSDNYRMKTIIIAEAIKNHMLVEDTPSYKKLFIENSEYKNNNK